VNRFVIALTVYAALGVLSWSTLADRKLRLVTLAVLAMFAVKTVLRRRDGMHADVNGSEQ
jgi:hypothetical protein